MDSTIIRCNLPRTDRTIELEGVRKSLASPSAGVYCLTNASQTDWNVATIQQVLATELDVMKHKGTQYFNVKGYCHVTNQRCAVYICCPIENCNKKLDDIGNCVFFCQKCKSQQKDFKWGYCLTCYIVDQTGKMYVHILGSTAEHLLEIKADLFHQYQEDSDTTKYENILMQAAAKSRILKICSKAVEYNMELLEESGKCEKRSPLCVNSPLIAMDEECCHPCSRFYEIMDIAMHYFPIEMQWMQLHDNATYLMHYNVLG
ncbi:unnamed protein product [Rotaria socialis]|uniref:Replication factor A C-terminal domain-containing protein n=1 Tax=Rotaria socialis TaxID=392032 RepID=A0A818DQ52_9BILA|nr:unnamed protein product [Rotaria socialis]